MDARSGTTDAKPAVLAVHAFRSGSAEQHREHRYGSRLPRLWWVLMSRSWVPSPVNFFLVEHRDGAVLFDTGIDPAVVTEPHYFANRINRWLLPRLFRFHLSPQDRLDHVLAAHGRQTSEVRTAVISHLHFDHVGGIAQIPQAQLIVAAREWAQLSRPHPEAEWILREHVELPTARWTPIEFGPGGGPLFDDFGGSYDVAGDGSITLLPTPGHTPGSMSMLVRRDGWAPILLAGDLTYEARLLMDDIVPGTGDAAELRRTYAKVRRLAQRLPGLTIVPSHDTGAAEALVRAMQGVAQRQPAGTGTARGG